MLKILCAQNYLFELLQKLDREFQNVKLKLDMQKVAIYPKTKLMPGRCSQEILEIWKKARGIWKNKKIEPIKYLQKTRKEWERKNP